MISVAIVEDDQEIRTVIEQYLDRREEFECSLAFGSVEEFLEGVSAENCPDQVLMDIGLPGMSGISGIRLIKERFPELDVIMLTVYQDAHKIFDSLRAGASGYLLKNTPLREIGESLKLLHQGGAPMSPQIARKVIEYFSGAGPSTPGSPLSPREKEIVIGLVDGLSYKMIADRMSISPETVRFHIKNIYAKLHVHSKAEVIAKSLRGEI
jgi:DNA-binding NarL/FixJ family response regulator